MEKSVEVSKELDVEVEIKDGKVFFGANYEGKIGGVESRAFVKTDALIDVITAKIPGTIDDKLGELLKAALKKV